MRSGSRTDVPLSRWFASRQGVLHADDASLEAIAADVGTPCYVYAARAIDEAFASVSASLAWGPHLIAYAVKANGNRSILARLARVGAGADVVSIGELARAMGAGIPPERIVWSGVAKTDDDIAAALDAPIRAIHVESAPELERVESIARARGVVAAISLRVNPDVDASTHPYIATGLHDTKFGLELDVARKLVPKIAASKALRLEGVSCHIGSQIDTPAPLADAVEIVARFALECASQGLAPTSLDAGGGWPIAYGDEEAPYPSWKAYGEAIREGIERAGARELCREVIVEPGRAIVGDAGVLLTRVVYVKEQAGKRFVLVDAGMTELIRPALYSAYHAVVPVLAPALGARLAPADVVGPVCETADFFALGRSLPPLVRDDVLAIRGAGAYGASMGSNYNARPLAPEVLVDRAEWRVVRRRQPLEDLWRLE